MRRIVDPMICGNCGARLHLRAVVRVWDVAKKILDGLERAARQLTLLPSPTGSSPKS